MIGLSLSSVSIHNIWSYYDWVVVVDNPIITRPHIVFTDGRQQRQPNQNTTTVTTDAFNLRLLYYDIKVFKSNVVFNIPFVFSSDNSMTDTNPIIESYFKHTFHDKDMNGHSYFKYTFHDNDMNGH
jgi:hypothetical protein